MASGIYDVDGKIRLTQSPGSGFCGLYATDGSMYFTTAPGSGFCGSTAPDGSLYIVDATGSSTLGVYAPNGAIRVTTGNEYNGAWRVSGVSSVVASWDASTSTLALLADITTHTRASLATMFDSTGKLTYAPNNLLLNTETLSTQSVNLAANTNYILTYYGTGSVALSGTASGTPSGTNPSYVKFASSGAGSATFTVTGSVTNASLAAVTYETSPRTADQVITTSSAYYGPRIDYDPNTLAVKGLLIEEARTNLAIQSEALSGASWAVGGTTKSTDGTLYLNGATATKLTATTIDNNHSISNAVTISVTSGQAYTQSWFVKSGTHYKVALSVGAGAQWSVAVFDISGTSSGVATQTGAGFDTAVSGVSTYLGGGWFRLALTFTASATGSRFSECQMVPATTGNTFGNYGDVIWLAAGTETLYVGQPQLEEGSFSTSYTPTGASAVTRAADVVQFTGAALTALQGSAGSAIVQMADQSVGYGARGGVVLGGSSTYWLDLASGNMYSNSGGQHLNTANAAVAGSPYRASVAWNASGRSLAMNGGTVATDAFGGWAVITPYLGSLSGIVNFANGHVASFAIYNQRLPDGTLQSKSVVGASY